jgi:hypothetical protein
MAQAAAIFLSERAARPGYAARSIAARVAVTGVAAAAFALKRAPQAATVPAANVRLFPSLVVVAHSPSIFRAPLRWLQL